MIWDAVLIGICAWVFSHILIDESGILSWWGELIWKLPTWLSSPLGECEYCLAGQMGLWYFLYVNWETYMGNVVSSIISHILFITLTIFVVEIINIWKQK